MKGNNRKSEVANDMSYNSRFIIDVAKLLIQYAINGKLVTYKELSDCFGNAIAPRNTGGPIGVISEACSQAGLPLLSAIVVNSSTGMPGEGFFILFKELKGEMQLKPWDEWQQECEKIWAVKDWEPLMDALNGAR